MLLLSCHELTYCVFFVYTSDNDVFVVRSFAALALDEDGNTVNETIEVKVKVCNETLLNDDAALAAGYTCGDNDIRVTPPANPDYLVNSLADIDGGTGNDRLTIVGTEVCGKRITNCDVILHTKLIYLHVLLFCFSSMIDM